MRKGRKENADHSSEFRLGWTSFFGRADIQAAAGSEPSRLGPPRHYERRYGEENPRTQGDDQQGQPSFEEHSMPNPPRRS
jgi:hypothetical protein